MNTTFKMYPTNQISFTVNFLKISLSQVNKKFSFRGQTRNATASSLSVELIPTLLMKRNLERFLTSFLEMTVSRKFRRILPTMTNVELNRPVRNQKGLNATKTMTTHKIYREKKENYPSPSLTREVPPTYWRSCEGGFPRRAERCINM